MLFSISSAFQRFKHRDLFELCSASYTTAEEMCMCIYIPES